MRSWRTIIRVSHGFNRIDMLLFIAVIFNVEVRSGLNERQACMALTKNRGLHAVCSTDGLANADS